MPPTAAHSADELRRHFRRHVHLYDATRWAALHGRGRLITALRPQGGERVLEIGCGTGWVLHRIARAVGPGGRAVGVDLCEEMLLRARRRCRGLPQVELRHEVFGSELRCSEEFDAVVLSYCLSMTPEPEGVLRRALELLRPGGRIGAVDFLNAKGELARRWLARYPLRLGGGDRDRLRACVHLDVDRELRSWTGLWTAWLCVGRPRTAQNTCM